MINVAEKEARDLMDLLIIASGAKTDKEKARVCWRANDHMWREFPRNRSLGLCRAFNNLLQDQGWPWVDDLWTKEEIAQFKKEFEQLMK